VSAVGIVTLDYLHSFVFTEKTKGRSEMLLPLSFAKTRERLARLPFENHVVRTVVFSHGLAVRERPSRRCLNKRMHQRPRFADRDRWFLNGEFLPKNEIFLERPAASLGRGPCRHGGTLAARAVPPVLRPFVQETRKTRATADLRSDSD